MSRALAWLYVLGGGLGLAAAVDWRVFVLALAFLVINRLYTHWFKHLPVFDLIFNMATHPLRLAGGMWLAGGWSHWPVLPAWGLACLVNCAVKRLYELHTAPLASRPVLRRYTQARLLRLIAACLGAVVGLWPFLRGWDFVLAGVLIMGLLRNGLNLNNISPFWQQILIGLIIIIAVYVDVLRRRAATRR